MSAAIPTNNPVAVIGIGCRFPGQVSDPASFWRLLVEGKDAIAEIPRSRFDLDHYFDPQPATPGRTMTRWGGFLENIDHFDAGFFGISPREAERLDPQQRLLLETAWEALEDAGQKAAELQGSLTGVFVGQWLSDFESRLFDHTEEVDFYMTTGSGRYASSGRLSYLLGLRGPSLTLDTACSSSLVAVHHAVRSIRSGESTLALAGGVNLILQPHISIAYSQSRMMAPDGHCKFADAAGDGYVRSEGAGLIVLRSLDAAMAAGDRIYAVIRGSAVNNDGRSSGSMGTPSTVGQEELLRTAYRDAGVAPSAVSYVEAHGTGTRAGDPVELNSLSKVLGEGRAANRRALVGSVKTNFGHTEGAAGIAGLIKASLALYHGAIPRSLHCNTLNPTVDWERSAVAIARSQTAWSADEAKYAGVSAFGIAGTNAHVVLEGAPAVNQTTSDVREANLLPFSARSPEALRSLAGRYAETLSGGTDFAAVCTAAAKWRSALECRSFVAAKDTAAAVELLKRFASGEPVLAEGSAAATRKLAFVVPGQGAQWVGMGRQLAATESAFHAALAACDAAARPYCKYSLIEELQRDRSDAAYSLERIDVIQPVLVALSIAYAEWFRSLGITPDAVVGHSMGEVGAAYIAGALTLDQAMRIICRRSALLRETSGRGSMAMIDLPVADVELRLKNFAARVSVAVINSPRSCVISGDTDAVAAVLADCESAGVFCRKVNVDVASHSPQMDGPSGELTAELADLNASATRIALFSTVLAAETSGESLDATYWGRNMREPVRFGEAVAKLLEAGITTFVELSPHGVLVQAIQQTAQTRSFPSITAIACGRRDEPEQANLLTVVGTLWAKGYPVHWDRLYPGAVDAAVTLPAYPWQRERYWVKQAQPRQLSAGSAPAAEELTESQLSWLHRAEWHAKPHERALALVPPTGSLWLIVANESNASTAIAAKLEAQGCKAQHVDLGSLRTRLASLQDSNIAGVVVLPGSDLLASHAFAELVQSLVSRMRNKAGAHPPRIWIATRGAQDIATDPRSSHSIDIHQASVWGAGRIVAEEHPDLWGGLVDLDPSADSESNATSLVTEILSPDGEDQVGFRNGTRFVLRLDAQARPVPDAPVVRLRSDGAYLITGGLGAIGLVVAAELVKRGARRLVLLGRTALPPRVEWSATDAETSAGQRIRAVQALEAQGASVHLLTADTGDFASLSGALDRYRNESWPAVIGVIHAAGTTGDSLVMDSNVASFARVLEPKLLGAENLDRLFPGGELFVVFSSIRAVLPTPGVASYAAANAGLDALVAARIARGEHGLSIQWGAWRNTGLFSGEAAERQRQQLEESGVRSFAASEGSALFASLMSSFRGTVMVAPIDWARFRAANLARPLRLVADRVASLPAEPATAEDLTVLLAAAESSHARQQLLEGAVRDTAARVLQMAPQRLDIRKAFGTMGLDSLMAIELRNRLEVLLRRPLSATLLWNYPTVESLAAFLSASVEPTPGSQKVVQAIDQAPSKIAARSDALAELSEQEVLQRLRGKGKRRS